MESLDILVIYVERPVSIALLKQGTSFGISSCRGVLQNLHAVFGLLRENAAIGVTGLWEVFRYIAIFMAVSEAEVRCLFLANIEQRSTVMKG